MKNICKYLHDRTLTHIFAMFFMVLDLRLTKVGTQRSPFFCVLPLNAYFLFTHYSFTG